MINAFIVFNSRPILSLIFIALWLSQQLQLVTVLGFSPTLEHRRFPSQLFLFDINHTVNDLLIDRLINTLMNQQFFYTRTSHRIGQSIN